MGSKRRVKSLQIAPVHCVVLARVSEKVINRQTVAGWLGGQGPAILKELNCERRALALMGF